MPAADARVSVFDSGFSQGIGLFETMRAHRGRVFRQERHIERLRRSAEKLGWGVVPEAGALRANIEQVVSAEACDGLRVRLTVTTGSLRGDGDEPPGLTIVAAATPGGSYPEEYYRKGVSVALCRYRQCSQDPTVGHKTTSYFSRMAALREAYQARCFESLWFSDENFLAEGCISNVFLIEGGALLTPPLDTPVLPGIARGALLDVAAILGVGAKEQEITIDDVLSADEIFLTNSMMGVMPVVRVDRHGVGDEKPGPLTQKLSEGYRRLVYEETGSA